MCEMCGSEAGFGGARGRIPRFCSNACKQKAYRLAKKQAAAPLFPAEMTTRRRWVRKDGKRPLTVMGWSASSTRTSTWDSYEAVKASTVGDGFGFMLGGGIGCIDLDHCIQDGAVLPWAREILDRCPPTFVEVSQSGTGLHIFGFLPEGPGRGQRGGNGVEFYSTGRFIAMTGNLFDGSVSSLADLSEVVSTL